MIILFHRILRFHQAKESHRELSVFAGDAVESLRLRQPRGFSLTSEVQEPSTAFLHIICQHPAVKRTSGNYEDAMGSALRQTTFRPIPAGTCFVLNVCIGLTSYSRIDGTTPDQNRRTRHNGTPPRKPGSLSLSSNASPTTNLPFLSEVCSQAPRVFQPKSKSCVFYSLTKLSASAT
jgi:hypothetical protein